MNVVREPIKVELLGTAMEVDTSQDALAVARANEILWGIDGGPYDPSELASLADLLLTYGCDVPANSLRWIAEQ